MCGILLVQHLSRLPEAALALLFLPFFLASLRYPFFQLPACFVAGCSWMLLAGHAMLSPALPVELEQQDLIVEGQVLSMPEKRQRYQRFRFRIDRLISPADHAVSLPLTTRLNWYKPDEKIVPGQSWRLTIRLKRPHGFINPGGFDYEGWLIRQDIRALGYVRSEPAASIIRPAQAAFTERVRYYLAQQIRKYVPVDHQGLVLALSLGDRSVLGKQQTELLQQTGTSHLIAISGLHLGIVTGMFYFLVRLCWARVLLLTRILPAPTAAIGFAFIAACGYAMLAGFTLPTQRALIMIALVLLSVMCAQTIAISRSLVIAALLVLLLDPLALQSTSFWLSFGAVAAILYLISGRIQQISKPARWFRLQFSLSLILFPLLVVSFHQLPVYSVAANIVCIPLIGFLVVPLLLLSLLLLLLEPSISQLLYSVAIYCLDFFWWYLEALQQMPMHTVSVPGSGWLAYVCGMLGIIILFMPRGLPARWSGVIWLLPLFYPLHDKLMPAEFQLDMLDVGQGLAALVRTENHQLLYDTGAKFSESFNMGDAVIVPFLNYQGVTELDVLIISHGDNDHIGGADAVIKALNPANILTSVPEQISYQQVNYCQRGQSWQWDGVLFEILHPRPDANFSGNNASCVLKVTGQYGSALLSGDIEAEAEAMLLQEQGHKLSSTLLVVPHHGSRTSSSPLFIDSVAPEYALFTAGYRNRFGLPKQDIIDRYRQRGVESYLSYQSGAIQVIFSDAGTMIYENRLTNRRFWHNDANNEY